MAEPFSPASTRADLDFTNEAIAAFGFLLGDGFRLTETDPTRVILEKDDVRLVCYHGRRSFEVGLYFEFGDENYSIESILHVIRPDGLPSYKSYTATTKNGVSRALSILANLVAENCLPFGIDRESLLSVLRYQGELRRAVLAAESRAAYLRPRATTAFREQRYAEASKLYYEMWDSLSPAERKKAEYAKRKAAENEAQAT